MLSQLNETLQIDKPGLSSIGANQRLNDIGSNRIVKISAKGLDTRCRYYLKIDVDDIGKVMPMQARQLL